MRPDVSVLRLDIQTLCILKNLSPDLMAKSPEPDKHYIVAHIIEGYIRSPLCKLYTKIAITLLFRKNIIPSAFFMNVAAFQFLNGADPHAGQPPEQEDVMVRNA